MLTLIRRTLGRVSVMLAALLLMLATFEIAIVAVASSLYESGGFDRIAGLIPSFLQQEFGPALTTFGGMTALGFFEPLIVILVVQFAIYVATEPAGEVESGLVDLILARPVPRLLLITRSLLVMIGASLVLPLAMGTSMWVSLWFFAPPGAHWIEPRIVVLLMAHLASVAWCFGGAALAAAAFAKRRGSAQTLVGLAAVAFYLMDVLGDAWTRMSWLATISPFHRFHGAAILTGHGDTTRNLAILISAGSIGVVVAYWQFQRRDV